MFFALLVVTLVVAAGVAYGTVALFERPVNKILERIIANDLSSAWHRYVRFAAYVVGVSGGVRVYELERYISAPDKDTEILELTLVRWTLEIYRTIVGTLQSMAWLFLVVFLVALIAYVVVRGFELRQPKHGDETGTKAE